ncbi:MAG: sucrase-isomaltase [Mycoplasmatales bacterium]|nr:sucrase-isomaltase [Mycoplasmatales bacterium]
MKQKLWKNKVIYQIFPRSFYDSDNDGNGDIRGIINKLNYLSDLGIDAIWLCPVYDTDFADAGYDVKNYKSIWKIFGDLNDFEELTRKAKLLNINIIMDIVLNHVSSKHPWFKKACLSSKNIEHNYFIWRDKLSKNEKANSIFGGSAWEYVKSVDKYYFHLFSKEQVDLNWEHPDTIKAMADIIDFWYKLGVRGFRLDAIKHISKVFPDGKNNDFSWGPTAVKQLQKFNEIAFKDKKDIFILGESSGISKAEAIKYGTGKQKISSNFYNFAWWSIGWGKETGRNGYDPSWDYKDFLLKMKSFQESKKIPPDLMTNFLSNHDTSRAISRWGDENIFHNESAKTLALLQFSLKGIPCIYYGEEIGMLNPKFLSKNEFKDVDALNAYKLLVGKRKIYSDSEMTKYLNINGRDNSRTPMSWSDDINAGFNDGHLPWIKNGFDYKTNNVKKQLKDKDSILNFYKKIIKIRNSNKYKKILVDGESKMQLLNNGAFKITRKYNDKKIIVIVNLQKIYVKFKNLDYGKKIISSWSDNKKSKNILRPYESIMFLE